MAQLVIARHGITEFNQQKRFTGFTDVSITDLGKQQAVQVGKTLQERGIHFDRVYTSWLKRAWETLDIILETVDQKDLPVTKHPFLNERHYGDLQGRLHEDLASEFGEQQVQLWRRSYAVRPPNGECLADVVVRAGFYLENEIMPKLLAGENVLICAHGNSNRAMIKFLEKISDNDIVGKEIAYDMPIIYEVNSAQDITRVL